MTLVLNDASSGGLKLWGGVECSIVRVGDRYRDQVIETGHFDRRCDIGMIADLGVRTMRYPILWETVAPDDPAVLDFTWHDDRLAALQERGVEVIAGLLHHGSGPHYTSLIDPDFPKKFADYAARVAERYPWISQWTPVNEPLTTARFSALYGHWYPHARNEGAFFRALVNESLGTLEAMNAVRRVNPAARLIQTEDLGKTFSTAPLRYQATFENRRRWLSFDLLCGRVGPKHPFHARMISQGIERSELAILARGDARPDMLGINHYLTSERFLDHRCWLYPHLAPGGNGRHNYVDAEAVRVKRLHLHTGIEARLREAWQRYRIPIAITEVHHGCTRDEQLRWFAEVWNKAAMLRADGVDIRAVTLWAMFGNVDWRSLLTCDEGIYDVGAFDARCSKPRPTAIAKAAKAFASGERFDHPVLDVPGWWRRPARLYLGGVRSRNAAIDGRPLLITGATGTLGRAFARICGHRGLPFRLTGREDLDLASTASIHRAFAEHRPWAVINTAGFVRVEDAERESEACHLANALGAENLARACADAGVPMVTFSSDLVFDGTLGRAYVETDAVNPAGVYGLSKAVAEEKVLALGGKPLIVRSAAFFGPWDRHNFAWNVLNQLARGEPVLASRKAVISPTFVPDLVHAALDLLIDGETGIWHLANQGALSWHDFARHVADRAGYDNTLILPLDSHPATNTALTSERGILLRPFEHAIEDYLRDVGELLEVPEAMKVAAE